MVHGQLPKLHRVPGMRAERAKPSEITNIPWFCPARSVVSFDSTLKCLLSGGSVNELLASAGIHLIVGIL